MSMSIDDRGDVRLRNNYDGVDRKNIHKSCFNRNEIKAYRGNFQFAFRILSHNIGGKNMEFYLELIVLFTSAILLGFFNFACSLIIRIQNIIDKDIKKVTLKKLKPLFWLSIIMQRRSILLPQNKKKYNNITIIEFVWILLIYFYYALYLITELVLFSMTSNRLFDANLIIWVIITFLPVLFPPFVIAIVLIIKKIKTNQNK